MTLIFTMSGNKDYRSLKSKQLSLEVRNTLIKMNSWPYQATTPWDMAFIFDGIDDVWAYRYKLFNETV